MSDLIASELDDFAQNYNIQGAVPQLPPKASKGNSFDFGSIVVQSDEDFARLPESQKQLLRNMKQGIQYTPAAAAQFIEEFNTKQAELSTPKAQADLEKTKADAELSKIKLKQAENEIAKSRLERRDVMLQAQSMLTAASKIEEAIKEKLVGPWKDVEQKFDGSGFPFSDPDEYSKRKALEVQTKKSIIDAVAAFKGPLSDSDRKFFTEMFPTINEPVGVWESYKSELQNKFKPISEGKFEMPAQVSADAAPQTPAPPVQQQLPAFQSKEQIMQAVNSGQISREQAVQALRSQFGNQFK